MLENIGFCRSLPILTLLIFHFLKCQDVHLGAQVLCSCGGIWMAMNLGSSNTCDDSKMPLIESPARSGHTTPYLGMQAVAKTIRSVATS